MYNILAKKSQFYSFYYFHYIFFLLKTIDQDQDQFLFRFQ